MSTWGKHFLALLKLLGWPGERSLNSQEYQVVKRFFRFTCRIQSVGYSFKTTIFNGCIEIIFQHLQQKPFFKRKRPKHRSKF